jgi:hypothetical protein
VLLRSLESKHQSSTTSRDPNLLANDATDSYRGHFIFLRDGYLRLAIRGIASNVSHLAIAQLAMRSPMNKRPMPTAILHIGMMGGPSKVRWPAIAAVAVLVCRLHAFWTWSDESQQNNASQMPLVFLPVAVVEIHEDITVAP